MENVHRELIAAVQAIFVTPDVAMEYFRMRLVDFGPAIGLCVIASWVVHRAHRRYRGRETRRIP